MPQATKKIPNFGQSFEMPFPPPLLLTILIMISIRDHAPLKRLSDFFNEWTELHINYILKQTVACKETSEINLIHVLGFSLY